MPFDHLSEFLNLLADRNELHRISVPVDPVQEVAAITQQVVSSGGPALLFDNVRGSAFPVVTNLLGTPRRLLWALGAESLEAVVDRIKAIVQPDLPASWMAALQLVPKFVETAQWPPRLVEIAVAQQVVKMGRDINLNDLPFLRCWPHETQAVIQNAQVLVEFPAQAHTDGSPQQETVAAAEQDEQASVRRLVSTVPIQVRNQSSCFVHWTPHSPEWHLLQEYRARGWQMPVAVALGGDPILSFAASSPLPASVDPLVFAGFLRRRHVELTLARSINLRIPAQAEMVLEGVIDPQQALETAPPIGLPTGHYSPELKLPVLHLSAVTHRSNPVIPAVVAAAPPSELDPSAQAAETIFLPLVQLAIPELMDLHRPASGAFRHIAFASIRKSYPQQARKVMNAIWGLDRLCTTKLVVVVDESVNVRRPDAVWFAVGAHAHPGRDILFSDGPADMLDHATPIRGIGTRMGIDATAKSADEGHPRNWPQPLRFDDSISSLLTAKWSSYGLPPP